MQNPNCPKCNSEYTYTEGVTYICPECAHEWPISDNEGEESSSAENTIKDSNGNPLTEGDYVTVIKDLKVKGSSVVVKVGTKILCRRIDTTAKDHEIDCKVPKVGAMKLTAKFTKKV